MSVIRSILQKPSRLRCDPSRWLYLSLGRLRCKVRELLRRFGGVAPAQLPFSLQATRCEFTANTTSFILLIVRNACARPVEHADLVTVSSIPPPRAGEEPCWCSGSVTQTALWLPARVLHNGGTKGS